jgi:bacillithiol biosynthesis cysteine-adding enzyme BshC
VPSERGSHAPESARIPVDIRRFPWIRKLAADYAFSFSSLAQFFAGDPASVSSWIDAIARAQQHPRQRAELAAILDAQLARRDAPAAARNAASLLADPKSVAILTGQQAGLFGGPLFTLYKALTALKLAERVQSQHGVPAIAVFWVEAEDHDWHEVSASAVLDADLRRRVIQLPAPEGAGHTPVGSITLGGEIDAAIEELAAALPATEFTEGLVDDLRKAYRAGHSMAGGFARWMDTLAGNRGLVVFDCSDRTAKPLASDIFAREVQHPGTTWQLAGEAGASLAARGYHAQVSGSAEDGPALFHLDGSRKAIKAEDLASLEADVRAQPASFSPNVLLRPIVEETLFPTVCYVSGPNELAYLAQLSKVYEHFEVPMPLVYPRLSATVLDSASARFLAKYDLPLEALQARDESALNRLLAASLPPAVDEALQHTEHSIDGSMSALIAAASALDPTLEGAARSTLGKLQHDLAALRGKIISAAKKRDETMRRQFFRAQAQAFPDGMPQERAISAVSLLNRYGPALLERLLSDLPLDLGHHWILTV